jgi:hypothetical protein
VGRNVEAAAVLRHTGLAVVVMCALVAQADAQDAGPGYDRSIVGLCRNYAAAIRDLPAESSFASCMEQRGCSVAPGTAQYQCLDPSLQPRHGGHNDGG